MTGKLTHKAAAQYLGAQTRLPLLADLALHLASLVTLWSLRAATRRALRDLPTDRLRDIGLTEGEAWQEAQKPFWRV